MKKSIIRLLMIIGLLSFAPCASFAQSASKAYSNGLAQMKKGDYAGAIASFKASMAINKSADNVKKCKAQIRKCSRLQARGKDSKADAPAKAASSKTLTLTTYHLTFSADEETKLVGVETIPESSDWTANIAPECESWCKLSKSMDNKELQVTCLPTSSTISRLAGITVLYDQQSRFIQVTQKGKRPHIEASKNEVKLGKGLFKKANYEEKISISCNSDTLYSDNKNWELVKSPDWCDVKVTSGNELTIKAEKLKKGDPDYKTGRSGYIFIRSQEEEFVIKVELK